MTKYLRAILLLFLTFQSPLFAQSTSDKDRIQELERKVEEFQKELDRLRNEQNVTQVEELRRQLAVLAEEVEKLRSGEQEVGLEDEQRRSLGLGPSASTVYTKKQGVSIAGYGEMLYENFDDETDAGSSSGKLDQIDFLRAIVYFGYRFNNRFLFNSEIEFEHASTGQGGEVSVEFAHVDYLLNDSVTLRGGMVLIPMGFLNEFHEPTVFLGARRPVTETVIIPTTWRENGFGIVGRTGIFDYRAYLVNGLNAGGFSSSGLRSGRQKGALAKLDGPSFVGRLDANPTPGFLIGGSFYAGDSGVFTPVSDPDLGIRTIMGEAHAQYRRGGLDLRALYARASLDDVAELNAALGLTGNNSVGDSLSGGYIQAGYDLLAGNSRGAGLTPYLRYEKVNTQDSVPAGFQINPTRDQTIWTFGLEYRPLFNIVVKADYQAFDNEADSAVNQ
ncbi:bZIP transcription factor, partial [bacterium]|nr:bZIP transcription factor [bacterium]